MLTLTYSTDDLLAERAKLEADALDVDDWIARARHISTKADLLTLRSKLSRAIRENSVAILQAQRAMCRRAVA